MVLLAVAVFLLVTERVDPTLGVILVAAAAVLEVVEIWLWMKYLRRIRVRTGVEAMVGEKAVVVESCRPLGTVRVRGELWAARCENGAKPGEEVEVVGVDGLTVEVKPLPAHSSIS